VLSALRIPNLALCAAAVATGTVLLAACGGGGGERNTSTPGGGSHVNVTLKEWSLTPDPASVPAGGVTFAATNDGSVEHEMVLLKTDLAADALPIAGGAVDEGAAGDVIDEIPAFASGATQTLTLALEPGAYVLFCNISGHYQQGVWSAFTVTAAASAGGGYY